MRRYHFPYSVIVSFLVCCAVLISADDYTVAEGNKSLVVALGCFWCAEQAFEQYAPGVLEAVSGYAGGTNDNPSKLWVDYYDTLHWHVPEIQNTKAVVLFKIHRRMLTKRWLFYLKSTSTYASLLCL